MVKHRVDFTNVSEGFSKIPGGEYVFHVFDVQDKPSRNGDPGVNVKLKVADGELQGRTTFMYLSETPGGLWRVRDFLQACGAQIPKKAVTVDFDKCLGKTIVATLSYKNEEARFPDINDLRAYTEDDAEIPGGAGAEEEEIPF
ncbi:MAG: DUF669 domain-containing protein [Bacteroidales bacterium]|nr:DUF669 domain-containing protein [Bacteroidales bacterium]